MNKLFSGNFERGSHAFNPVDSSKVVPFVIDQFAGSEFFISSGCPMRDYEVYALSDSDPALRQRIQETLIERDVSSSPSDLTDEQITESIVSKYDSTFNLIDRVKTAIRNLRDSENEVNK